MKGRSWSQLSRAAWLAFAEAPPDGVAAVPPGVVRAVGGREQHVLLVGHEPQLDERRLT